MSINFKKRNRSQKQIIRNKTENEENKSESEVISYSLFNFFLSLI